jgi:hypothetical protein
MTDFVEVKTSDLEFGAALDWAVAQVEKVNVTVNGSFSEKVFIGSKKGLIKDLYKPSTDWSQGGPLIEKYQLDLTFERKGLVYAYPCKDDGLPILQSEVYGSFGPTHLVAACRAIVAAKLGDTVSVPAELVKP